MPPSARRRGWRSDALIGLAVVAGVLALHATTDLFGGLERRFYDFASSHNARAPSDRIAIIAIDDQSIANIGRWPWPREVHAQLIDQLKAAGAKTVAHTALFFEPQTARGLDSLRALRTQIEGGSLTDLGPVSRDSLVQTITKAEQQLDSDGRLVASMAGARNVIVPSVFELGEPLGPPDQPLPAFAQKSALVDATGFGFPAAQSQQPIAAVGEAAVAVAHLNQLQDSDGAVRQEPLLLSFDGHAVPSMGLAVAAHSLNLGTQDIRLLPGEAVQLGRQRIATDELARVLPQFYPDRDGRPAFAVDSFYDVVSSKIPAAKYAGKIVIVGATAAGVGTVFTTPVAAAMSPAVILAHISSSILQGHFIAQPVWGGIAMAALVLAVVAYLLFALPRLSAARGAWVSGVLFMALLGIEYGLLASSALWLQLVFPAALLLIGHLALVTRRFGVTEARKVKTDAESAETNRMMGLALQGQGQLDMAFDRLKRVTHSEALMDNLKQLALDFERKRQFNKAQAVYEHMAGLDRADTDVQERLKRVTHSEALMDNLKQLALDFERKRQFNKAQAVYEHMAGLDRADTDVQERLKRAKNLSETVVLGGGASHPGGTLLLSGGGIEKPMLGRYQVEKELGKGAMGVVYLGRDPKIGRQVAIKTLALSSEFEGGELKDARERFFREAETAGRLQHPHIVTIFDAGEEHDLAYIAMEFLRGQDLVQHTQAGRLLPLAAVLRIGAHVAQALDYAHQQNVVHRDIKPGNIMYDPVADSVKVTDFGIARITDASRTRTGLVLGTPSFMSPEQLAGQHIDGRSDLYSLGVTLFQLLTGSLPLRADSMAALMYQIANETPPDVRSLRPELPSGLTDILGKAMSKAPKDRFQSGAEFAQSLQDVMGQDLTQASPQSHDAQAWDSTQAFEKTLITPRSPEV